MSRGAVLVSRFAALTAMFQPQFSMFRVTVLAAAVCGLAACGTDDVTDFLDDAGTDREVSEGDTGVDAAPTPDVALDGSEPDTDPADIEDDAVAPDVPDATVDAEDTSDTEDAEDASDAEDTTDTSDADTADTADTTPDVVAPPNCGDGTVQADEGEACDDGNLDDTDTCTSLCQVAVCGDGFVGLQPGDVTEAAPVVTSPFDATGPVCDSGATCPGGSCDVSDDDTAPEHGICQAMGYFRAVRVTWGGSIGADETTAPRAWNWGCFDYECGAGPRSDSAGACGEGRMLESIVCEGFIAEVCDDGENGNAPNQCREGCALPVCGDGVVDDAFGEDCDDANDIPNDGCNRCLFPQCGDGVVQAGEACDDGNDDDTDACRTDCQLPICGDGFVQPGEECDDGADNSDFPDACRPGCIAATCGDFIIDSNEDCDDGNLIADDGCSANCLTPQCGDGILQTIAPFNEACDDGNRIDDDGCSNLCQLAFCGDGIVQSEFASIDTFYDFEDGVIPDALVMVEGDWTIVPDGGEGGFGLRSRDINDGESVRFSLTVDLRAETELSFWVKVESESCCDDVNLFINGVFERRWAGILGWEQATFTLPEGETTLEWTYEKDGSVSTAGDAGWIDGIRLFGAPGISEACDDGDLNANAPDACRLTCELPTCGDGIVDSDESCDDGNLVDGDACSSTCNPPVCGDGVRQGDEECDDGNDIATDTCQADCTASFCGDGIIQSGERVQTVTYGFEDGTIPDAFTFTGSDWTVVNDAGVGSRAIRSRDIGDNQSVRIETSVVFDAETEVTFWLKVESESCCDDLNFFVDGVANGRWAGTLAWQQVSVTVPAGPHVLAWTYEKDGSVSTGGDSAWLDEIQFEAVTTITEVCDDGAANSDTEADACRTTCVLPTCGDGGVDTGEECDDGNLVDGDTCSSLCTLPICGDGIRQGNEECDLGDGNDDDAVDGCRTSCRLAFCSDGVVDTGEECDDGNLEGGDGCSALCRTPRCGDGFADLTGEFGPAEECDDGNTVEDDACSNDCLLPVCGDGLVEGEEACDDANASDLDTCTNACELAFCGDGIIQSGEREQTVTYGFEDGTIPSAFTFTGGDWTVVSDAGVGSRAIRSRDISDSQSVRIETSVVFAAETEVSFWLKVESESCCDDLNFFVDGVANGRWAGILGWQQVFVTVPAGPHVLAWTYEKDGSVSTGGDSAWLDEIRFNAVVPVDEACDDGALNADAADACRLDCSLPICGDGIVDTGEACDDANLDELDGCSTLCQLPVCGDGIRQGDEACDDGNTVDGDDCTGGCTLPRCGDGTVDPFEACDDGDLDDDNICANDCTVNGVAGADFNIGSALGSSLLTGTTVGAGNDHQPPPECTNNSAPDVSVGWFAPAAGQYDIDLCGSDFDTYLVVRSGAIDGPVPPDVRPGHTPAGIACDDDDDSGVCGLDSRVVIAAEAGEVFTIWIEGLGSGAGAYVLNINAVP